MKCRKCNGKLYIDHSIGGYTCRSCGKSYYDDNIPVSDFYPNTSNFLKDFLIPKPNSKFVHALINDKPI